MIGRSGVDVASLEDVFVDLQFIEEFQVTFLAHFADQVIVACASAFSQTALVVGDGEYVGAVICDGEESDRIRLGSLPGLKR